MKSGFISILGKPNVGKSSLMNALIGDTPGVHKPKNRLGEYMEKCVKSSTDGVDAIVIVLDVLKRVTEADEAFIEKYLTGSAPVFIVLNKVDESSYDRVYPILNKLAYLLQPAEGRNAAKDIIPTSAKKNKNIDVLKKDLESVLPEGPMYYPADEITDKSERYMIAEIIREKALLLLNDEIPHGIGVEVRTMFYDEHGTAHMSVDIVAEKESHKSIIIGSGGEKLKMIAERARKDVENLIGHKVYMELFVKVRENWRNDALVMSDVGYDTKKN